MLAYWSICDWKPVRALLLLNTALIALPFWDLELPKMIHRQGRISIVNLCSALLQSFLFSFLDILLLSVHLIDPLLDGIDLIGFLTVVQLILRLPKGSIVGQAWLCVFGWWSVFRLRRVLHRFFIVFKSIILIGQSNARVSLIKIWISTLPL